MYKLPRCSQILYQAGYVKADLKFSIKLTKNVRFQKLKPMRDGAFRTRLLLIYGEIPEWFFGMTIQASYSLCPVCYRNPNIARPESTVPMMTRVKWKSIRSVSSFYPVAVIPVGLVHMAVMAEQLQVLVCIRSTLFNRDDVVYFSGTDSDTAALAGVLIP
jgi:hypothetical protein